VICSRLRVENMDCLKGEAACLPFCVGAKMDFRKACIFVDGENLRHSLCDLFTSAEFSPHDYLPKSAAWQGFFDHLVRQANAAIRLRTYWYTVAEIDFWPYDIKRLLKPQESENLLKVIRRNDEYRRLLDDNRTTQEQKLEQIGQELHQRQEQMLARFGGWQKVQNGIAANVESVEFRRAGSIRYDLMTRKLGNEKGVDVKLATDLLTLQSIYDVAIILSGDADYVPAVQAVKDCGKHVINVSFLKKSGGVLPGGARRLNQATDRVLEIPHDVVSRYLLPQAQQMEMTEHLTEDA